MHYSFWEKKNIEDLTEITIIGAGIVGLSTAISIKEANPKIGVKILERGSHPNGASTKNAGFACFGSISEILDDVDQFGDDEALQTIQMRWQGLQLLRSRIPQSMMEYDACGGIEAFRKADDRLYVTCLDRYMEANTLLAQVTGQRETWQWQSHHLNTAFYDKVLFNSYEGKLNPQSMMSWLYRKAITLQVAVYYGVEVVEISDGDKILGCCDDLHIKYDRLVVCTNGFAKELIPDLDVYPGRNQVLITKPLPNVHFSHVYHVDKGYLYFRTYQNRLLLGGGRNLNLDGETTSTFGMTQEIQDYLTAFLETLLPGGAAHIDMWWSGILGMGTSKKPIVSWVKKDVLCGVRLGGMGVAIGSQLGHELAMKILEK
ncbi:MAG: FAD-binding oxidoreductase [Saprospiraceae bacterium]